jgi:hypothetical protein
MDSERGSASLYEDLPRDIGSNETYQVFEFGDSFDPKLYIDVIHAAEREGFEVIVIDSLSHAWDGVGGALDKVDQKAASSPNSNSFSAWRDVSAVHRRLVDAILQSPCHIICTLRSKTEYVLETNAKGKQVPRKIGIAPIQRQGMEYEFTVFLDIDDEHFAYASKDRTRLLDGQRMLLDVNLGEKLLDWLNKGTDEPTPEPAQTKKPVGKAEDCNKICAKLASAKTAEDVDAIQKEADSFTWGEKGAGLIAKAKSEALNVLNALHSVKEPPAPKLPAETTPQVQVTTAPTTTQTYPEMTAKTSTDSPVEPPPTPQPTPQTVEAPKPSPFDEVQEKPEGTRKKGKELIAAYEMASTLADVESVTEAAAMFSWSELGFEALIKAESDAKERLSKKAPPPNEAARNPRKVFTDALMAITRATTLTECEIVHEKYVNTRWNSEDRTMFESAVKSRIYELTPKPTKRDSLVDRIQKTRSVDSLRILEPDYSLWSPEDRNVIKQAYQDRITQLRHSERETERPKPIDLDPYKRDWWEKNSNRTGD